MKHPCCIYSNLSLLKEYLNREAQRYTGCKCLSKVDIGPYGVGQGHKEWTEDTMYCYKSVLLWLAEDNQSYARRAVDIIETWSQNCKSFSGANAPLEISWGCCMIRAAEILKHKYNNWSMKTEENLNIFIDQIMLPNLLGRYNEIYKWKNNWILSILEALMQIYIFRNDTKKFEWTISEYKKIAPQTYVGTTGKNNECERDWVHATFQLHSHVNICEMAYQQGVDLYDESLRKSCEYLASVLNGKCPPDMPKEKLKDVWFVPGTWSMCYNHFVHRKKNNMPETRTLLQKKCYDCMSFSWGPSTCAEL